MSQTLFLKMPHLFCIGYFREIIVDMEVFFTLIYSGQPLYVPVLFSSKPIC